MWCGRGFGCGVGVGLDVEGGGCGGAGSFVVCRSVWPSEYNTHAHTFIQADLQAVLERLDAVEHQQKRQKRSDARAGSSVRRMHHAHTLVSRSSATQHRPPHSRVHASPHSARAHRASLTLMETRRTRTSERKSKASVLSPKTSPATRSET